MPNTFEDQVLERLKAQFPKKRIRMFKDGDGTHYNLLGSVYSLEMILRILEIREQKQGGADGFGKVAGSL